MEERAEGGDWRPLEEVSLSPARHGLCTLGLGEGLLVTGGYGAGYLGLVELLGPDLTWETLPPLSTPRSGHACDLLEPGVPVVAGGVGVEGSLLEVEVLRGGVWQPADGLPGARFGHSLARLGSRLVVAGGQPSLREVLWLQGEVWEEGEELVQARFGHCAVSLPLEHLICL